jgi:hemolysin III
LHGTAACASFAVALYLAQLPGDIAVERNAFLVLALTHFALYTVSALYHSMPWVPVWKSRMQRLDHAMIYLKIAAVVTLIAWLAPPEGRREWPVAAAWAVAALGAAQKLWLPRVHERASIGVQVLQAGLALPALPSIVEGLPGEATLLLLASGSCYSLGAFVFVSERPSLWPRVFSFHELFHVLVVLGSGLQTALAVRCLPPGP